VPSPPAAPLRIEARAEPAAVPTDRARLTFDERTRSRLLVRLESGVEAALALPRGAVLRHGDRLLASDDRIVEVLAAPEPLLHVEVTDAALLARAAYHLGNRHVAVELRAHGLRVAEDAVLERMLRGLGLAPVRVEAPFEPEGGAYGSAHAHRGEAGGLAPVIHEYRRS
jgi:urease accessory protein